VCLPPEWGLPSSRLVVKRFGWRGIQHYLSSPFKRSRAMKAYHTACHLLAHGLRTPLPLGVVEERRWGFVQYNVYATEAVADAVTLQQYYTALPDGPTGLEEVIRLVACYIRRMHDSGLWHRDLVSSNLLITGPKSDRQVYLVDLNRARRLPYMPAVLRAIDLARLGSWEWLPQLCELYSAGRFSATRLWWMIGLYSHWRTWRWHIRRRLKPLRARLRI
jgi:tRNA A-37 threonylcarbamoyl transferase component Bud32